MSVAGDDDDNVGGVMLSRVRVTAVLGSVVAGLVATAVTGCGSSAPTGSPTSAVASPSRTAPASVSSATAVAGCDVAPWHSVPVTVTHLVSVPPVPVITEVRVAQHPQCGYDRVVLDLNGAVPNYTVRYVNQVTADASGQTITMPGSRYLLITIRPAQAHNAAGTPTVTSGVRRPGYPRLESWALAGDFEGVVRVALGVTGPVSIRTGELAGRIYIDVRE